MADYGPKEMSEKDKEFYRKYEEDNMREFRERLAAQRAQNIKDAKAENETPFEKHVLKLILAHRPSFTSKPGMAYLMSAVEEMPEERLESSGLLSALVLLTDRPVQSQVAGLLGGYPMTYETRALAQEDPEYLAEITAYQESLHEEKKEEIMELQTIEELWDYLEETYLDLVNFNRDGTS